MNLRELIDAYGAPAVASVIGVSHRQLVELRRGGTAITVDDLYELEKAFPSFDLVAAVRALGSAREKKHRSRKHRTTNNRGRMWKEQPTLASKARGKQ